MSEHPPSPCVNICAMDPGAGICVGCHRTLDEIAGWGTLPPAAKLAVLDQLPGRKTLLQTRDGDR